MTSFKLPARKTFVTSRGTSYSYVHIVPASPSHQTLLLLHGFPSQIHDWSLQIEHFSSKGYGIVAPDLLGFGQSSQPEDAAEYRLRPTADDLAELLDAVKLPETSAVVGVGHDIGATILSRFEAYHPRRCSALVFLAVGPPPMGTPFDVDAINTMTKQMLGFELLGYMPWLTSRDSDAQETLEQHAEAAMSLMFCADRSVWDSWFRPLGKMQQFVKEDRRVEVGAWYPQQMREKHIEAFGRSGGYGGAVQWYRMWQDNLFAGDEVGMEDWGLEVPVLFVGEKGQAGTEQQKQLLGAWAPKMSAVELDAGHWIHLERARETNQAIEMFLQADVNV